MIRGILVILLLILAMGWAGWMDDKDRIDYRQEASK